MFARVVFHSCNKLFVRTGATAAHRMTISDMVILHHSLLTEFFELFRMATQTRVWLVARSGG